MSLFDWIQLRLINIDTPREDNNHALRLARMTVDRN